jgi:hypothetical protein
MSAVASAADPGAALNRILRGNFQQAVDAWATLEPKLRTCADGLAAAIRRCDVEVMSFEYKRVEAFNRGVGALLNRIAAALEDLDAIAGEPEFAAVQARAAMHVHALGAMKKTLARRLQIVNRLQAQAAKGLEQARRRSAEFDIDWERLQDQVEQTLKSFESLHDRMARVRGALASAKPLTLPLAETGEEDANKIAGAEPASNVVRLRRELGRIDDAVVRESTSPSFAVQFRKERPKLEQQFERMASVSSYLRATAREISALKVRLRRSPPG